MKMLLGICCSHYFVESQSPHITLVVLLGCEAKEIFALLRRMQGNCVHFRLTGTSPHSIMVYKPHNDLLDRMTAKKDARSKPRTDYTKDGYMSTEEQWRDICVTCQS